MFKNSKFIYFNCVEHTFGFNFCIAILQLMAFRRTTDGRDKWLTSSTSFQQSYVNPHSANSFVSIFEHHPINLLDDLLLINLACNCKKLCIFMTCIPNSYSGC